MAITWQKQTSSHFEAAGSTQTREKLCPLVTRRMVVGPPDLRDLLASRDEAAFVLQRRLAERIRDEVLARGLIRLPAFVHLVPAGWWWWIHFNAAIALRRIANGERE